MAEVIQFNCPACGTMLRLPISMASQRGPCPNCDREIIAPDPHRGIGAFEIPEASRPREIEPFWPFAESPPLAPQAPEAIEDLAEPAVVEEPMAPLESESAQAPDAPPPVTVCAKTQLPVLILACLLTGAVTLAWGFALGVRSKEHCSKVSPPLSAAASASATDPPVAGGGTPNSKQPPVVVKTMGHSSHEEKPPQAGSSASSGPEASLEAFLDAPDWITRSAYVLAPDEVRSAMEAYSREVPDGPTAYKAVTLKQNPVDEKTGKSLIVFHVITNKYPAGIPVTLKETPVGWRVDWQTFVEFRDGHFSKFVDGPVDKTGSFHVIVTRPGAERAAKTENEYFASFLLQSPMDEPPQMAFVRKSSETFATFQTATDRGAGFKAVLEVVKRKTSGGQGYVEVVGIIATDWLPEP